MKKTFLLLSLFFAWMGITSVSAQSVTVPEDGAVYTIKHLASGFFLTRSTGADNPIVRIVTADTDQQFQFILVAGTTDTYNILNVGYDEYLARKDAGNGWTMFWVADPNAPANWANQSTVTEDSEKIKNAQWQIVDKGDYVVLKNVAGGGYVGTDIVADDPATYANKSETDENSKWIIAQATGDVDKEALQKKYDEAKPLYDNTTEGTGSDQYPANTRTALKNALDYALEVLEDNYATVDDVSDALSDLVAALDAYRASVYPFLPDPAKTYYIQHSSGFYFTGNSIAEATYAADQQFKFVSVGGQWFNIHLVNDPTQFLTRSDNGWDLIWAADPTVDIARFVLKSTGDGYYTIQCAGLTGEKTEPYWFIGTDNNTAGSGAYVDKNGKDGKHKWKPIDIDTMDVVKTALEDEVAKADDFLAYAVRGDGADQYPATEYNALTAANTAAKAVIANENATQEQVSAATTTLKEALAACIAAVKPLNPDETKEYSFVHYGGLFLEAHEFTTGNADALHLAAESKGDNQKVKFIAVPDTTGIYNITIASVPGKYLTRCTDPHPSEEGKYDDYKLVWLDDATSPYAKFEIKRVGNRNYYSIKCITVGPQRANSYLGTDDDIAGTGIFTDKSGTDTNHYWKVILFGTPQAVKEVNVNKAFVYSDNGNLKIAQLKGNNKISVYSTVGQLIFSANTVGAEFEKQLPKGIYVVVVNGETLYRGITVVK